MFSSKSLPLEFLFLSILVDVLKQTNGQLVMSFITGFLRDDGSLHKMDQEQINKLFYLALNSVGELITIIFMHVCAMQLQMLNVAMA